MEPRITHWIDAHAHIFPDKIAEKATEAIGRFYDIPMQNPAGMAAILLEEGKKAGMDRILVCSSATTPRQVESIDRFIAEECGKHPEFVGLATMHPGYDRIYEELRTARDMGLRGIKLHPDFQQFKIDDPDAFPIYEAASDLGLPILFHTGDARYEWTSPVRLARVAKRFPQLKCIGAHFGGYSEWEEADRELAGLDNVWFDTSSSLPYMPAEKAAERVRHFGIERMMFGTDFPMWNPSEEKGRFLALPLTEEEREQVAWKTFADLFGIEFEDQD